MVGGSLLVIYEGSPECLRTALDDGSALSDGNLSLPAVAPRGDMAYEGRDEEGNGKPGPPFTVKLIDFAHTKLEKGLGPDQGVLFGLDTTIRILEGRIREVQEVLGSVENVV